MFCLLVIIFQSTAGQRKTGLPGVLLNTQIIITVAFNYPLIQAARSQFAPEVETAPL